ncbi:MAG: hypothetical protein J6S67_13110 [Methanobrevibacter sp.]|nr:hypothetical protein [Methanobrevibacter sp.]
MKRTYDTKVVTVIFKSGETATFENCLNIYESEGVYNIIFACDDHKMMCCWYGSGVVAMIAKGYVESEDLD